MFLTPFLNDVLFIYKISHWAIIKLLYLNKSEGLFFRHDKMSYSL